MTETEAADAFTNLPAIIGCLIEFQENLVETETEAAAERLRLGLRILRLEQEATAYRNTIAYLTRDAAKDRVAIDGLCADIKDLEDQNASLRDTLEGWADAGHHNAALKAQP